MFFGLPSARVTTPLSPPTRDFLNLAIRSFTAESEMQVIQQHKSSTPAIRDWGGWMDALPSLSSSAENDLLSPAIMALAASIITHKMGPRPTKASYLEAYGTAIHRLQTAIKNMNQGSRFMILATIICLYTAAVSVILAIWTTFKVTLADMYAISLCFRLKKTQ